MLAGRFERLYGDILKFFITSIITIMLFVFAMMIILSDHIVL